MRWADAPLSTRMPGRLLLSGAGVQVQANVARIWCCCQWQRQWQLQAGRHVIGHYTALSESMCGVWLAVHSRA
jgi:hypothetical protein